jgi:IrrE N-terminal-like domain
VTPEEKAAQRLLYLRGMSPPVNVEKLARNYADIEFDDLPVSGDAMVIRAPRYLERPLILLNKSQSNAARRRFTIAHEIGHLALGWHSGTFACHVSETNAYISGDYGVAEAEANRFASELLMPTPWVKAHIESCDTIEKTYKGLKERADVSYEAARIKLLANLPPGFVCMVEGGPGSQPKIAHSAGTRLSLYLEYRDRLEVASVIRSLDRHAVDGCIIPRSQLSIRWWKVDCRCEAPDAEDDRPSTTILRELLELLHDNAKVVIAGERSINGLVSSANQSVTTRDTGSLYGALKLRFGRRDVLTNPFLQPIVEHPVFESFLVVKAKELAAGKNISRMRKQKPPSPPVDGPGSAGTDGPTSLR